MSLPKIPDNDLRDTMVEALSGVFSTMLDFDCELRGSQEITGRKPPAPNLGGAELNLVYVGSVGFVGKVNGVVYLYLKSHLADEAARRITGLDEEEIDFEMVTDLCGELTNMFGGSFKNRLADLGYDSQLTIPTVVSGDELYISTLGVSRHLRFNFVTQGDEVAADLVLAEPAMAGV